ncbi:hypothetical protein EDB89DRAFT_2229235 [Lactarius sanguifluus]|nr:hypothetical protein EDB89DRAFT_2229235 [Lactarius sanguifluus]
MGSVPPSSSGRATCSSRSALWPSHCHQYGNENKHGITTAAWLFALLTPHICAVLKPALNLSLPDGRRHCAVRGLIRGAFTEAGSGYLTDDRRPFGVASQFMASGTPRGVHLSLAEFPLAASGSPTPSTRTRRAADRRDTLGRGLMYTSLDGTFDQS